MIGGRKLFGGGYSRMKKTILLLLCAGMLLCAAACGETEAAPEETPVPEDLELVELEPEASVEEIMDASAADAEELKEEEAPASATDAVVDEEAYHAALDCVGLTLEELYAAVGEPTGDVSYGASCLEENAEDGMLFYDDMGFYVWTVRTETEELVHAVYTLD